jgi:hypothetical protein
MTTPTATRATRGLSAGLATLLGDHARGAALTRPDPTPQGVAGLARTYRCRCGRPVFFPNSECLACHTPLGYDPESARLLPLEPADRAGEAGGWWREAGAGRGGPRHRRCVHLDRTGCNWLLPEGDPLALGSGLCRSCRLTRTLPDLSVPEHPAWWSRIEHAKRRLVSSLIALGLPLRSKVSEDPQRGLAFDLLRAPEQGPAVLTGHTDGVITLDVQEADDARREQRRTALGEPYRTLLGHLRHESGHYYWQRLLEGSAGLEPWRALFGDERQDYAAALQAHYRDGAPADWASRFVSAYASSHPWEDWAETWAHHLHLVDTLGTARSLGLDGRRLAQGYDRFDAATVGGDAAFARLLDEWVGLTAALNELSRSMGVADFYPFVLSDAVARKLQFVHRVVAAAGRAGGTGDGRARTPERPR